MKRIISIDGAKGGVGKSIIATAVIDYIQCSMNESVLIVDADNTNPDVGKSYSKNIDFISPNLDEKEGFLSLADSIANTTSNYIVINCPARSHGWITHGQILIDNLKIIDAEIFVFWMISRQRDSVETLKNFHTALPNVIVYPILNGFFGDFSKFETWKESNTRADVLAVGGSEVFFPDVADRVISRMKNERLRWDEAQKMPFGDLIEVNHVRGIFHAAFSFLPCFKE